MECVLAEFSYMDAYARLCEHVQDRLTLEECVKLFPEFSSPSDWDNPSLPYNHVWNYMQRDATRSICSLFEHFRTSPSVFIGLLKWYKDTADDLTRASQDYSLLMEKSDYHADKWWRVVHKFFLIMLCDVGLAVQKELFGRCLEGHDATLWQNLQPTEKLSLFSFVAQRYLEIYKLKAFIDKF